MQHKNAKCRKVERSTVYKKERGREEEGEGVDIDRYPTNI